MEQSSTLQLWQTPAGKVRQFVLLLLVFIAFGTSLRNGYSLDDELVTAGHPITSKGVAGIPEAFSKPFYTIVGEQQSKDYRPLVLVSYAIEFSLWKYKPAASHAVNLLLYALLCLVLLRVLERLFRGRYASEVMNLAFLISLLFAVHPLHTEVVASLKNRDEILALLFGLLAFGQALSWLDTRKPLNIALFVLYSVLAALSKLNFAPWILLTPLVLWFFDKGRPKDRALLGGWWLLMAVVAASLVFGLGAGERKLAFIESPLSAHDTLPMRLAYGLFSYGFYLFKLIFPYQLLAYYGYAEVPQLSWASWQVWLSLAAVLGLAAWGLQLLRTRNPVGLGIWLFGLSLIMVSQVLQPVPGVVADRYMFLGVLGGAWALVFGLRQVWKLDLSQLSIDQKGMTNFGLVMGVLLSAYTFRSIVRTQDWAYMETLYTADFEQGSRSFLAHHMLGRHYYDRALKLENNDPEKIALAEKALNQWGHATDIYEKHARTWNYAADVQLDILRNPQAALGSYTRSYQIDTSRNAHALYGQARCLVALGRHDSAEKSIQQAIRQAPESSLYLFEYGYNLFLKQQYPQARQIAARLVRVAPNEEKPHLLEGNVLYSLGHADSATSCYERALAINPKNGELAGNVAAWFRKQGRADKAQYYENMAAEAMTFRPERPARKLPQDTK